MKKNSKKIMSMLLSTLMLLGLTANFNTIKVHANPITYETNIVVNGDGNLSTGVGTGSGSTNFVGWTSDQGSNTKFLVGNSSDFSGSAAYDANLNDIWFDYYPSSATSEKLYQTIDISSAASDVDSGNVTLNLSAFIRKYMSTSTAILRVEMLDNSDNSKGTYDLNNNSIDDRSEVWQSKTGSTAVVSGTRKLKVSMIATISPAAISEDYIDFGDIKLTLSKIGTSATPTVTTSSGSTTFKEGGQSAAVDSGLTVSATQIASATVSITGNFHSSEDVLSFTPNSTNYGNIAGSYDAASGVLTLTSSGSAATLGQWQAALRSVTYNDTLSPPIQTNRTVSFGLNDGTSNSAIMTKIVTVTAIPKVTTSSGSTNFNWSGQVIVDSGVTVNSPSTARLASATVSVKDTNATIYTSDDVLAFTNNDISKYGNISGIYNQPLGILTLTSSGGTATLEQWQAALRDVTYKDISSSPHIANRVVSFVVNDGANDSKASTKTIVSVPLVTTATGTTAFTEGGQPVAVDSGLTVSASKLSSAIVSITGNLHSSEDVLGFTNDSFSKYGNISSSFTSSAGVLTLTSSGATATLDQWQAALQTVTYSDSSNDPSISARTVSFVANDGTNDSNAATKTVSITAVNNPPTLAAIASNPSYNAGNSAVALFSGTAVSTVEAGQNIKSLILTVNNVTDGNNEILGIDGSDIPLTNSSGSTANNNFAYVVSLAGSTATVTILGDKSCTDEKSLIDGLTYKDSLANPTKGNRIITLTSIQDNGGTDNGGTDTATLSIASTVKVISVPGAPTIGTASAGDAQASVTFTAPTEDGGSSITGYTVTATPAGVGSTKTATGASSPITVTGLINGTSYTFTVAATNSAGIGAASSASSSVTPMAVPVYISAAGASITAPILGAAPQNAATVEAATLNADYTVTNVVWNEGLTAGNKFKAGQVYTATVTLTSKNGKEFQAAAFTPTVSGAASIGTTTTTGTGTGNTVSFTVTYGVTGALQVSSIAVTTQPTKMSYTEGTDGTLALNGMQVTETNNDGSTNVMTFTNGTAAGYTTSPANGATLTNGTNNNTKVTVTHTASSQTAQTNNLSVATAAPVYISAAGVSITAPILGAAPQNAAAVESAAPNADYTVTNVAWNEALTAGNKFKAGQVYTATVTLTSKNGKEFQAAAFTPTVAGAASVGTTTTTGTGTGNTVSFTVTYGVTGALQVSSIAVTTQPTKMSYTEGTDGTLALNGMQVTETNNDGSTNVVTFTNGTATGYTTSPANGATLTNGTNNNTKVTVTHTATGQTAQTNNLSVATAGTTGGSVVPVQQPTTETRQVPVVVENGNQQTAAIQTSITRTTDSDGYKKDTVVLDESTAAETVKKALETKTNSAAIVVTEIPGNNADKTEVQLQKASIAQLSDNNMTLTLETKKASLEMPAETIAESKEKDIKVQISEEKDSNKIEENKGMILKIVSGSEVITAPLNIEANITGRVKINIPIDSSKLPSSKEELDKFLSLLAVSIHHSDGEDVVDKGTLVHDEKGNVTGIAIWVDKFSSFTLINMPTTYFQGKTTIMKDKVAADKEWQIKFTKPADSATVTKDNVYVVDLSGNKIESNVTYTSDNVLKVAPVNSYKSGETYYLYITKGIKAKNKTSLVNGLRYQFTIK